MTNPKGDIIFINQAGCQLLGIDSHHEVLGKSILDFYARLQRHQIQAEVFSPLLQKEKQNIRWESELKLINRRKNSSLDVLATFFSIHTSSPGEEQGDIAIIMRDITERKAAEKKIRQSEEKYRNLVETMEEGIVLVDTEGITLFVNDQLVELFGYEKSEFLEQPFFEMLAPDARENAFFENESEKENTYLHINPSEPYKKTRSELQLRKRSGELIWLWVSSNPIKDELGNITGYISALADVTSLKQAQNEILEVNKEMEQLLYRASHDLKGPISSIEGIINLMRLEIKHEQMAFYSDMMMASIKKLLMRIKDLTKLSAIKNKEISMQRINVLALLEDLQKTFEFAPQYKRITFEYDIEPIAFYSDESLFRTIMQNFVENSIKYADPDKEISFLKISLRQIEAKTVLITIQDNGIGIHQNFKDRIFEMFFRATDSAAGTGMGLYIVSSAVKKLGGSLRFETRYREGTTFYLKLPIE
jgi:PAS domain S-box-containing protein